MSTERKVLVDVTERSHVPHKKRNRSSSHMMQKTTMKFKARGGKCQCTKFSGTSEGHRLVLCSLKNRKD